MKVVRLLQDMQAELEKEKADDDAVYKKLTCWCEENDREKTAAIEIGKDKMSDLKAALGEYAAKIEELRVSLAETKTQLREDQKALDAATAIRTQEAAAFHTEEKELLDTIQACKQALVILSRHHPSLMQLQQAAKNLEALKTMQLAKDTLGRDKLAVLKAFLQQAEDASSTGSLRRIPGFQSYTPQSGQIYGILKQMQEEFESNLDSAQKAELKAREDFTTLKAAKEAELDAGRKKQAQLEQDDAQFREKNAQAYEELNDVEAQVKVDETFLANLKKRCSETDAEYEARRKSRLEEIAAVADTIAYLNSDEAFDVFDKTVNTPTAFLQTSSVGALATKDAAAELRSKAAKALRKAGSLQLAALASSVQLDAFEKVKAAIDKMVAELKTQQQEEVQHRDWCNDELAKNQRSTEEQTDKKANLETDIADGTKTVGQLTKEIEASKAAIAEMEKEMKKASEIREGENADFQETVTDQQITQAILQKALDRMKQVYALAQLGEEPSQPGAPHVQLSGTDTEAGNGPARFTTYDKSSKGTAVVVMLQNVLADAKKMEADAHMAEQDAQSAYESFMKDSNASIKSYQRSVVDMTEDKAKAEQALTMAKEDLVSTDKDLENLHGTLTDLNGSCDFLLHNFEARQEARSTEISALNEAKAILSGMQ